MQRIRYLKPDTYEDTELAELPIATRYLYIGMWPFLDRQGLIENNPKIVRKNVFPYDEEVDHKQVAKMLSQLIAQHFLIVVEHEGREYLWCPTFKKHQMFHKNERPRFNIPEDYLAQCLNRTSTVQEQYSNEPKLEGIGTGIGNGNGNCELVIGTGTDPSGGSADKPPSQGVDVSKVIGTYVKAWQAKYKTRERPDVGGKIRGIFLRLLKEYPVERLCNLVEAYCQIDDPWFKTKTHDIPTFEANLNKIALALGRGDPHTSIDWGKIFTDSGDVNGTKLLSGSNA